MEDIRKVYLKNLAVILCADNKVMKFGDLLNHFNSIGFKTEANEYFKSSRGVSNFIEATYHAFGEDSMEAEKIAKAFVNKDGKYAYE